MHIRTSYAVIRCNLSMTMLDTGGSRDRSSGRPVPGLEPNKGGMINDSEYLEMSRVFI